MSAKVTHAGDGSECVKITPMPGKERLWLYRKNVYLSIPDDVLIDTCVECGGTFCDDEQAKYLSIILKDDFAKQQKTLVGSTLRFAKATGAVIVTYDSCELTNKKISSNLKELMFIIDECFVDDTLYVCVLSPRDVFWIARSDLVVL